MRPPSLANILVMALLVFAILSLWAKVGRAQSFDPATFYQDCWETCFNAENAINGGTSGSGGAGGTGGSGTGGSLQNEYNQLYKMVEAARTTRLMSGTNSTLIAYDTTPSSDPLAKALQLLLAQLTVITSPCTTTYNPAYIVFFDSTGAWYGQSAQGLGRCDAVNVLGNATAGSGSGSGSGSGGSGSGSGTGTGTSGSGSSLSQLEQACLVGAHAMNLLQNGDLSNPVYDASFVSNPVVFTFTTSKFETAETACGGGSSSESSESNEVVDGSTGNALLDGIIKDYNKIANQAELINSGADFNAYCSSFFGEQFIAGTGGADAGQMESWSSIGSDIVDGSHYIPPTQNFVTAAQQLVDCMKANCCPSSRSAFRDYGEGLCITADAEENFVVCGSSKRM